MNEILYLWMQEFVFKILDRPVLGVANNINNGCCTPFIYTLLLGLCYCACWLTGTAYLHI